MSNLNKSNKKYQAKHRANAKKTKLNNRGNYRSTGCDPTLFLSSIPYDLRMSDLYSYFE